MKNSSEVFLSQTERLGPRTLKLRWSNGIEEVVSLAENGIWWVTRNGQTECFSEKNFEKSKPTENSLTGDEDFYSPVTGRLIWKKTESKSSVKKGESILVLESMKMQTSLQASADGEVDLSGLTTGQLVSREQFLFRISKN